MRTCSDCGKRIDEGYVYFQGGEHRCEKCHRAYLEPLLEDHEKTGNMENDWMLKCFGFLPPDDSKEQEEIDEQDEFYWTEFDDDGEE